MFKTLVRDAAEPSNPNLKRPRIKPKDCLKFNLFEVIPSCTQDPDWAHYPSYDEAMFINQATPFQSETMKTYSSQHQTVPRLP